MGEREPGWYEKEVRKIISNKGKFVERSQLIKDAIRSSTITKAREEIERKEKTKNQ